MPRIAPVSLEKADAKTAATLSSVKTKLGMLPNLITTLARAPAALDGYLQLSGAIAGGRLSARQREQIAIAVANENHCGYCLSAHAAIGKSVGLGPDDIERARQGQPANPLDRAITDLALAILNARGGVTDNALEAARDAGVDHGLVVEIVANVALNVMTNYLNRVADTDVDFPAYPARAAA